MNKKAFVFTVKFSFLSPSPKTMLHPFAKSPYFAAIAELVGLTLHYKSYISNGKRYRQVISVKVFITEEKSYLS